MIGTDVFAFWGLAGGVAQGYAYSFRRLQDCIRQLAKAPIQAATVVPHLEGVIGIKADKIADVLEGVEVTSALHETFLDLRSVG